MKILVTGATARHVGRLDPFQGGSGKQVYHACPHIFVRVARAIGHEVDQRPVLPRESLRGYDCVCVFLGPLVDPQMTFVHGALAALASRKDALVFLDDWKVGTIASSFRRMAARGGYYLWDSPFASERPLRDEAYENPAARARIERVVGEMSEGTWDRRVVVPLHAWGDPSEIVGCPESRSRAWLDYTPGLTYPRDLRSLVARGEKHRAWLLATLGTRENWVRKQAPTWPIERYGYKAVRISQYDVMRASALVWGSLAPRYPHARASWWRPRFAYSARTLTVVACDEGEGISRAAPQLYGLAARYIESFSDASLRELAISQARFVAKRSWKWGDLACAVDRLIKEEG